MPRHNLQFPAQPGPISFDQITEADRAAIQTLGAGARLVIDVGTFLGGSAEALFAGMPEDGRLVTVDTYCGTLKSGITDNVPPEIMLTYAVGRLWCFRDRMTVICGESTAAAAMFAPGIADVVFIDAGHDYESVKADIRAWLPCIKPGGIIAGHDFDKPLLSKTMEELGDVKNYEVYQGLHPGVAFAVQERFDNIEIYGDAVWRTRV